MNESMSATVFQKSGVKLAEEHYQRGNLKGAIQIVNALTFDFPNSSVNHCKISQTLAAYQIHWRVQQHAYTHYDILNISSPFCSHKNIRRKYDDLLLKLRPGINKSVAAKSAFEIINTAWKVLSDPERRMDYNIKQGFWRRSRFRVNRPRQSLRLENRRYIVNNSDSDSDSDN